MGSILAKIHSSTDGAEVIGVFLNPKTFESATEAQFRFCLNVISIAAFGHFNQILYDAGIVSHFNEAALLAAFLRATTQLIASDRESIDRIIHSGWLTVKSDDLADVPQAYFDDIVTFARQLFPGANLPRSFLDLFEAVLAIKGSMWPFRAGPAIHKMGNAFCLDLYAATMMLSETAEFSAVGGLAGNLRGNHFEKAVQRVIDETPWRPPPELKPLSGFMLRDHGKDLSDIDAVALRDHVLLLVSCKSRIYSDAYDRGDQKAIFATAKLVQDAWEKWCIVTEFVRSNPDCLKTFQIHGFDVIGVVCLPYVPYVPIGACTEFVAPALRAVVSIGELKNWLNGAS